MRWHKNIAIAFLSAGAVAGIHVLGTLGTSMEYTSTNLAASPLYAEVASHQSPPPVTKIVFVGDIMFDRGIKYIVEKNFGGDWGMLFENAPYLKDADITFGNLEGPVSTLGKNVGSIYSFHMDPVILPALKAAGFDIVSFANNHVGDWSKSAFDDTRARLDATGIQYTGAGDTKMHATTPTVLKKNGIRFGFLGFSDVGPAWLKADSTSSGILLASDPDFEKIIHAAKDSVDVLIVSVHWGEEYMPHNDHQTMLAKRAIESGADLVIGHHPHVIQASEIYKDGYIAYSLGNFIFDQNFSTATSEGEVLAITFTGKERSKVEEKIVRFNKLFQPQIFEN